MIVVSGATGTIGKDVVKNLQALKASFKVLARDPKKAKDALGGVDVAQGDFANPSSLESALKGADAFFLLVNASPDQPKLEKAAIDAAKKAGVKRVVYLSALGADPGSPIGFAKWHGEVESHLKASGLAWTILQPHAFMQNTIGSAGSIKAEGKIYAPMNDAKFSTVDTRDIAAVAAHTLAENGHEGKTYVITGGEAISYKQIAAAIGEAIGKKVEYVNIPNDAFKGALESAGLPGWMAKDLAALMGYFATGAAAATTDVVEKVGKKKPWTFPEFAKAYAQAFRG